jgi:predicted acetyltransferase
MDQDKITVRKLSAEDLDQYNELLRYAFQITETDLLETGWERDEIRQSKFAILQNAHVLGCFDGDDLVSQFAVYPINMNIHSEVYSIGVITGVATYPEYSGMKLMTILMRQSLTHMRETGQSLALLYPYSIPLYRHRGWEIISDKMKYKISDKQLPQNIEVPGYVRRVDEDNADLIDLHARFAAQTHGCLFRNELAWEEYWRWDEEDINVAIYYNADDVPMGYMVYLIAEDIFRIKEMIYINYEAFRGLLKYVAAHDSMIDEVRGSHYYSEPIAFKLDDSEIKETIRPYLMGRIIDFEQFLEKYRFEDDADGISITFNVTDPFLEWNNRKFTVAINKGKGKIVNTESKYKASLSIGTLTTLLLGYKNPMELAKIERIEASEETIKLIHHALIEDKPYISDYI